MQALLILGEKTRLFETAVGDFELNTTEKLADAGKIKRVTRQGKSFITMDVGKYRG